MLLLLFSSSVLACALCLYNRAVIAPILERVA